LRRRRIASGLLAAVTAFVAVVASPALAVTGTVTDVAGEPIEDARVCHLQLETGREIYCVGTDEEGGFEVVDSGVNDLRISAEGYFPESVPATGHHVIVLELSPTLLVRLVDATTREPIAKGEVFVIYPSAKKKGPFPANRAGVRITRVLRPGEVRLLALADGYEPGGPLSVTLEAGKESEATLELRPSSEAAD
jgi:hypothetical protein